MLVRADPAGHPGHDQACPQNFQFIEAGLFVALTAAALGATIWLLHRRPA